MSKKQVIDFCAKKFSNEGIPTLGWAKFFQDILDDKLKSVSAPGIIQHHIIRNQHEPITDNELQIIINQISEGDLMPEDFDHIFENLKIYLANNQNNIATELKLFCRQIYQKFLNNIDLINQVNEDINALFDRKDNYQIKLGNLKDILYQQKIIATDQVLIEGLKLMAPFFANPFDFNPKLINNFTHQDKNLGALLAYEINNNDNSFTLNFGKSTFTICNQKGFDKIIVSLYKEGKITQATYNTITTDILPLMNWDSDAVKLPLPSQFIHNIQAKQSPLANTKVLEEFSKVVGAKKELTKSQLKLIDIMWSSRSNLINHNFFSKEENKKTLEEINKLDTDQIKQLINFHQKYQYLKAERVGSLLEAIESYIWQRSDLEKIPKSYININVKDIEYEDLKSIVSIFTENFLIKQKFVLEFIINFINASLEINNNFLSIVKEEFMIIIEDNDLLYKAKKKYIIEDSKLLTKVKILAQKKKEQLAQSKQSEEDFQDEIALEQAILNSLQEQNKERMLLPKSLTLGLFDRSITEEAEQAKSSNDNHSSNEEPLEQEIQDNELLQKAIEFSLSGDAPTETENQFSL